MTAFEWPVAAPIDLSTYPRRDLYEHFLTFEIPVTTRTVQLDITQLQSYAKGVRSKNRNGRETNELGGVG